MAWCLDDFTEANGATCFAPQSHRLSRTPRSEEGGGRLSYPSKRRQVRSWCSKAESWHRTGHNRTADETRAGVFAWYTKPIYRTQENWFLSLRPEIRQFASEEALVLLGYKTAGLGLVNGASPA